MLPWGRQADNGPAGFGWAIVFGDLVYLKPHMGGFKSTI